MKQIKRRGNESVLEKNHYKQTIEDLHVNVTVVKQIILNLIFSSEGTSLEWYKATGENNTRFDGACCGRRENF